jgi:UPF0755 protein
VNGPRRFLAGLVALIVLAVFWFILAGLPMLAGRAYGPPSASLSRFQVVKYSARLLWYDGLLTQPGDPAAPEQDFSVRESEPVLSIASRLVKSGIIRDVGALVDYLVYTGLDKSIQAGSYSLSPRLSIVDIAHALQDATPAEVAFIILPGWRIEEIAAALPTSGLEIAPEAFLSAAGRPAGFDFMSGAASNEGILYPDSYIVDRKATAQQLVDLFTRNFALHLTTDLREGFSRQGLSVYEGIILASIVEREAVRDEEKPVIASVYLNRLRGGIKLDADPTIQYALGYDLVHQTWWTNPLGNADFTLTSPYNTYIYAGLPPGPISNPGLTALRAVAIPAETPYYYFRARCDDSGLHLFAETLEEQIRNECP